ncbi:hypothetical protein ABFB50_04970 [Dehalococcoides sp. THU3]|uniref:OB-fold protein n=1 Tax=Dehalococcoides TaxID=61434 RepID=UPI003218DC3C
MRANKLFLSLLVILSLSGVTLLSGCQDLGGMAEFPPTFSAYVTPDSVPSPDYSNAISVDATQILNEFNTDMIAARAKYYGNAVSVIGVAGYIRCDTMLWGVTSYLQIGNVKAEPGSSSFGDFTDIPGILGCIPGSYITQAARANVLATYKVTGICAGMVGGYIILRDCTYQKI